MTLTTKTKVPLLKIGAAKLKHYAFYEAPKGEGPIEIEDRDILWALGKYLGYHVKSADVSFPNDMSKPPQIVAYLQAPDFMKTLIEPFDDALIVWLEITDWNKINENIIA